MKNSTQKPINHTSHPLQDLILQAFEDAPTHSVIMLLPYFGAMPEFEPRAGLADYRGVITDALEYMARQGRLSEKAGMYWVKGV